MWADNETSEDLLGFKVHADLLVDVINDKSVLPITIGVFGEWGSGKSSILKIIEQELSAKKDGKLKDNTLVLYFNGWIFEGYDDAKAALLESIIEQFDKHKTIGSKVKDKTRKLFKSVNWMRLAGLSFKKVVLPATGAYLTGGISLIPFLANEFSKMESSELIEKLKGEETEEFLSKIIKENEVEGQKLIREFREDFKEMIEESKIEKLVVIIDDLDRCTPDRLIENLEAIKLFLNVDKTAFIIGADPRIVRHAIEFRYKTDDIASSSDPNSRNRRIVSDYLEKLIQVPYFIPKLTDYEVETYLTLLFCKNELKDNFSKVIENFQEFRSTNRYDIYGIGNLNDILESKEKELIEKKVSTIASLSSIITQGLNGNPRQIKRFLNTFILRNRLVDVAKIKDFRTEILAKLMVLEYSSPSLFKTIYDWQSTQNGNPNQLKELETLVVENKEDIKTKFPDWYNEKLFNWLNSEPKLTDVDLRDYYWISRDQLSTTISGASLISPHIRSLLKKLIDHGSGKILENLVKHEISNQLNESETQNLLHLLEKEISKTPQADNLHKVYIELISHNIENALNSYKRIISQVDNSMISFSLRNDFQLAEKKNADIKLIYKLFDKDSKISKALKQKRN